MRDAVIVWAVFSRLRRKVYSGVVNTDSTPGVRVITPRADFFCKHRSFKSHIPFFSLDVSSRKDFYDRAAQYYIETEGGVTTFFLMHSKSNHSCDISDQCSSSLLLLLLHFHLNDDDFACANTNVDASDACDMMLVMM